MGSIMGGLRDLFGVKTAPIKSEDGTISWAEDYELKFEIKKAGPFLTLPLSFEN